MAPRILIFGTGSIGGVYAWVFSNGLPTSNIVTVCRSNYEAASKNGFTIHSTTKWGPNLNVKPTVVKSVTEAVSLSSDPFDYILITSKVLPTTPSTPEIIAPAVSPNTAIVLIQNGIRIEPPYAELFPNNPLLSTVVYLPTTQISPGVINHRDHDLLHVGPYPSTPNLDAANAFAALLTSCGGTVKVHQDVQFERWSKLLINSSWNPICALSRCRDAQFLHSSPEALSFVVGVMREIAAVAQACGYAGIDEELIKVQVGRATGRDLPGIQPSMLADAVVGRSMEVDAIVGNVVDVGRELGIKTPMLEVVYMLVKGLDASFMVEK